MEKITITFDKVGNTLDVWFEKPRACINEELGNGVIIKKDENGKIIGFEKINYLKKENPHSIQSIPVGSSYCLRDNHSSKNVAEHIENQ